jgi:crossover junction endodeoxyribonuclease RuvC
MRYLGLDLSLTSPAFVVIDLIDGVPKLVGTIRVKTSSKENHGYRLEQIRDALEGVLLMYGPFDGVIREKRVSPHQATAETLSKVVGIADLVLRDYTIREMYPSTIKKIVTGNGKAEKEEVEQRVRELLSLPSDYRFASDDVSDAAAVVLAHLIEVKKLKTSA